MGARANTHMKYVPATSNIDRQLFKVLLQPSWLSASLSILIGLAVGLGTVVLTNYQSSSLHIQLANTQLSAPTRYQALTSQLAANSFISNLPLLLFWTLVGLVVYLFVANIFASIRNTAELHSELGYVNANRHGLLMGAAKHLLLRLTVLMIWIAYIIFFMNHILPYCVASALAGTNDIGNLHGGLYILLSIAIMTLAIHLNIIFLRLLLLRPRVFSSALYVD